MISPDDLKAHIDMLKAAGVTGPVEIEGVKLTIAPPVIASTAKVVQRSLKADYDRMLFAATEGIPDDEERT